MNGGRVVSGCAVKDDWTIKNRFFPTLTTTDSSDLNHKIYLAQSVRHIKVFKKKKNSTQMAVSVLIALTGVAVSLTLIVNCER